MDMTVRHAALAVIAFSLLGLGAVAADRPAGIPVDYALVHSQSFDGPQSLRDFVFTDPGAWRHASSNGVTALELVRQSKYAPPVRSPVNIALLNGRAFGDFTLDVDLIQTGEEYGHRDMCLFFGLQNPTNFYYVHLATKADNHAHNIFVVTNAPRIKIARETTAGVNWGLNVWHKVRLERHLADGSIKVYFDDLTKPVMTAMDKTFGHGAIGFGSFDDTGMVDNIRLWSSSVKPHATPFFRPALSEAAAGR